VRTVLASLAVVGIVSISGFAWHQARPASVAGPVSIEEALKALRADLQASRADIIAKNVTMTSEQAAKFWPMFERYQAEQSAIMDAQMKGIAEYAEKHQNLSDRDALGLMKAHLDRDRRMVTLRETWLGEFQKVLPGKIAARVMQIDRRISLAHQVDMSAQIPLVQ
jgi:ABC-type amino acid transport substrate-binding protein